MTESQPGLILRSFWRSITGLPPKRRATASTSAIQRILRSYSDRPIIFLYALIRFHMLRQRFLEEIGQYLPAEGSVIDIGCGFGLFALFFGAQAPGRRISGFDLDEARIETARRSGQRLGIGNVTFELGDASRTRLSQPVDAVYMLDIAHHIPPDSVEPLIESIAHNLRRDGVLLVKDIAADQAGFSAKRDEICRDYVREDQHGFCSLRVTEARALSLSAKLKPDQTGKVTGPPDKRKPPAPFSSPQKLNP